MGWEVKIYNQNRSVLLRTLTPQTPGGLDGDLEWQLQPNGDTVNLQLNGRNDTLGIPPRGVVTLAVDGDPQFWGIAPDVPSLESPDAEAVIVAGGSEALRVTLMDGAVYRSQGVYVIARDILSRLCPPALIYDPAQIGNGSGTDAGPTLDTFYSPTAPLTDVLKALAASAQTTWGVDVRGRVFLGRPNLPGLAVAYTGQPWKRLPTQGRETVTRAVLRLVSAPSLPDGASATWTYGVPATVVTVATHPDHASYQASRAYEPPEGVGLIVPAVPAGAAPRSDYPATAVMDDDPSTSVTVDLTNVQRLLIVQAAAARIVGVEFEYTQPNVQDAPTDAFGWSMSMGNVGFDAFARGKLPASNSRRTVRIILPPEPGMTGPWNAEFVIGAQLGVVPNSTAILVIYRVRFLVVDEAAASRVAETFLQVPFASPAELTLPGLTAPAPTVTVTGSPDGTVSGPAGLFVYQISAADGRQTLVRLGTTGQDQTVRALKWAVQT